MFYLIFLVEMGFHNVDCCDTLVSELEEGSRNFQRCPEGSINLLDPFLVTKTKSRDISVFMRRHVLSRFALALSAS